MIRSRRRRPGQQATDPARLGHPRRPRTWSRSCCRERASWITGGNIVVDGGQRYPSARRPPRTSGIKQRLVSGWVAFCKTRRVAGTGLPELDVARVRRWCEQRVPAHVRDQIRVECEVAPRHLTIVECRAPGRPEACRSGHGFPSHGCATPRRAGAGRCSGVTATCGSMLTTGSRHRRTLMTSCGRSTPTRPRSSGGSDA